MNQYITIFLTTQWEVRMRTCEPTFNSFSMLEIPQKLSFFFLRINPKIMVTASLLSVQDYQLWSWTNGLVGSWTHKFLYDPQVNLKKEDTCWGMFPTLRNRGSEYVCCEVENWLLHTQHRFWSQLEKSKPHGNDPFINKQTCIGEWSSQGWSLGK